MCIRLADTFPMNPSPERGLRVRVEALQQSYADARREVWQLERQLDKTFTHRLRYVLLPALAAARRASSPVLAAVGDPCPHS